MAKRIKKIKVAKEDGQFSEELPLGANSDYVDFEDEKTLKTWRQEVDQNITNLKDKDTQLDKKDEELQQGIDDKVIVGKVEKPANSLLIEGSAKAPVAKLHIIGQSIQDGEPSPEDPKEIVSIGERQEDGSFAVGLRSIGKNLFNKNKITRGYGVSTQNGSPYSAENLSASDYINVRGIDKIIASGGSTSNQQVWGCGYDETKKFVKETSANMGSTIDVSEVSFYRVSVQTSQIDTFQIEVGEKTTNYKPYEEPVTSIISLSEPLCGLKVDSGGNYTDDEGQQWITDEIVKYADGTGEIIKRTHYFDWNSPWGETGKSGTGFRAVIVITNIMGYFEKYRSEVKSNLFPTISTNNPYSVQGNYVTLSEQYINIRTDLDSITNLSTFLQYMKEHKLEVVCRRETPTTTPLTAQQIAELEKLYTFNPVTNVILNTSVGVMDVSYYKNTSSGQAVGDIHANAAKNKLLISEKAPIVYGFHIDGNESNPDYAVTYVADAVGMTPARMNYGTGKFDYGSWKDTFFMPKPCMLKSDGTVDYYLNPDDYTKKMDGTSSDVTDDSYDGNAMMEWGQNGNRIWYKVEPDADDIYSGTVYISNTNVDGKYHAWSFINSKGELMDHFYTAIYNGSVTGSSGSEKMRSLSIKGSTTRIQGLNATQEITYAERNNKNTNDLMWSTETLADAILINFLLVLISKSLDSENAFGNGHIDGGEDVNSLLETGQMDQKGMFWGTHSDNTKGVKVFGMENWWGDQWRRVQGHINDKGKEKIKLTYGMEDGSTVKGYNTTGNGYIEIGNVPTGTNASYINKMEFNEYGLFVRQYTGSSSTYYCDGFWTNNAQVNFAFRGGDSGYSLRCGAFCWTLSVVPGHAWWSSGAALSCKPISKALQTSP